MPNSTWKQTERQIARRLGGQRVPITGRARGSAPDIAHTWLSIEVKHRKTLPQWLKNALAQAQTGSGGRLAIVVLHQAGQRHADDLVLMRLSDFESWFGSIGGDDES